MADDVVTGQELEVEAGPLPRLIKIPGGMLEEDIDGFVDEALGASKVPGVVRVRIQPDLYFHRSETRRQRYDPWPGVNWVLDLNPEQAREFRRWLDGEIQGWVSGQTGPDGVR